MVILLVSIELLLIPNLLFDLALPVLLQSFSVIHPLHHLVGHALLGFPSEVISVVFFDELLLSVVVQIHLELP